MKDGHANCTKTSQIAELKVRLKERHIENAAKVPYHPTSS